MALLHKELKVDLKEGLYDALIFQKVMKIWQNAPHVNMV